MSYKYMLKDNRKYCNHSPVTYLLLLIILSLILNNVVTTLLNIFLLNAEI